MVSSGPHSVLRSVPWLLGAGCVGVVLYFRESSRMEAAFGLAVMVKMLIINTLLAYCLHLRRAWVGWIGLLPAVYLTVEGSFLVANPRKFPQGGWLSVLLGAALLLVMISWIQGRRLRQDLYKYVPLAEWLPRLQKLSADETGAPPGIQFVIISRTLPYAQSLSGWQRLVARISGVLRWFASSPQESFGLDNSSLTIENIPLLTPERPELHLTRE